MAKKKLAASELKLKKVAKLAKTYTDLKVSAAGLKKYEKGTPNTGYLKTIILSTATTQQAAEADANRIEIDIPKDFLVKSGSKLLKVIAGTGTDEGKWMVVEENGAAVAEPYEAPSTITSAGLWIDLIINTKGSTEAESDSHVSIPVNELIDTYTGGNGVTITNRVVTLDLDSAGGLQFTGATDGSKQLAIKIDSTNANGLALTSDGLKLNTATSSSAGAMSATDKINVDQALLTNAELASWFGWDITGTPSEGSEAAAVKAMLEASGIDDSITDEA